MGGHAADLAVYSHSVAGVGFLALGVYLWHAGTLGPGRSQVNAAILLALACSAAWAFASALERTSTLAAPFFLAVLFDLGRYAGWMVALLLLLREPAAAERGPDGASSRDGLVLPVALLLAVAAAALVVRLGGWHTRLDFARAYLVVALALPVLGLVLVEQLFRNLPEDARWLAKPVCLALAATFAFDVYLFSEGVLFGALDVDALSIRGAVHLLAVPLLFIASRRRGDWVRTLQVSRRAAFFSAALLLSGGYLMFISAIGWWVRYSGGEWGRGLQLGLLFASLVFLLLLALSASIRARVRVFVGKHFFSYRFDYREEWLAFTAMLSSHSGPSEVGVQVIRALGNMVECPAGSLWTRRPGDPLFAQAARWNAAQETASEPADSDLCGLLAGKGWLIDLDECRRSPEIYDGLRLPAWLAAAADAWIVVPLLVGEDLLGFVVLSRPRTPVELDWEVRDLLKTGGRQAAGYLAQMQATEALLEARKFDAFNRMSAFVVHDLKNIVTQLSLMLKNAERLHGNPEFQQDMLLTVESSLDKMRRLMLQLREGATPAGGARGVGLSAIVRRVQRDASTAGRRLELEIVDELSTRGHEDRLERVLGHLVQNAFDATGPEGRVWVKIERYSGQVRVEVGDTGAGMTEDFVQNRLFKPFSSTKHSGMGIGSFESQQYIRELGGSLAVDSAPGKGTVIRVLLPLFDAGPAGGDLAGVPGR